MIFFQKVLALIGLNLDDDVRFLQNGEYTNAVNVRVGSSIDGKRGLVENIQGVKLIPYPDDASLTGALACQGAHFDKTTRSLFFLICSSNSDEHSVFRYDEQGQYTELVYQNANLNFNLENKITGFTEIDGMLFWCNGINDSSNEPVQLYWRKAMAPTAGNYSFNQGYDKGLTGDQLEEYLKQIKRAPTSVILPTLTTTQNILGGVSFSSGATVITVTTTGDLANGDIIRGFGIQDGTDVISFVVNTSITLSLPTTDASSGIYKTKKPDAADSSLNRYSYQFVYNYVYWNNEQSTYSSVSKLQPVAYPDNFDDNGDIINNAINVHIPVTSDLGGYNQDYAKIIKYINIAYREGYNRTFKICKRINFPYTNDISPIQGMLLDSWATENDGNWTTAQPDKSFSIDTNGDIDFIFSNLSASSVVDTGITDKPYDAVPLKAQGLELNDGSIFEGNYITGYDNFFLKISDRSVINAAIALNTQILKPGSTYQYGIMGIDKYGRKSLVQSDQLLLINTAIQGTFDAPYNKTGKITHYNYLQFSIDTALFPAWVFRWQIVRTGNETVVFWAQGRVENIYYVTGRDINKNPRFTKLIGGVYNLTTTPSSDYVKTYEAENAYRLSQIFLDSFNYSVDVNTSVDSSQANEIWIDISNLTKYKTNEPYVFSQGDRVRFLTLGGMVDDDANVVNDFPIKEVFDGRFLVVDSDIAEYSGIDTVDYGIGNTRLFVAVSESGEVWFSKGSTFDAPLRSGNLSDKLNKVAIRKPSSSGDCYVVIVGDSGSVYLSKYSLITENNTAAWTKITTLITGNITNVFCAQNDTDENFFVCGDNGLVAVLTATSAITMAAAAIVPVTGSGYDLTKWQFRGIDTQNPDSVHYTDNNYWVSLAARTQQPTGYGGCCVVEINKTTLVAQSAITSVGDSTSGFFNDCVSFTNANTGPTYSQFTVVLGGAGNANYGNVCAFEYNKSNTVGSRSLNFKGAMKIDLPQLDPFGEITGMCKARANNVVVRYLKYNTDLNAEFITLTTDVDIFYGCDVNGNVLARGIVYDSGNVKFAEIVTKLEYASNTSSSPTYLTTDLFPVSATANTDFPAFEFPNLPSCILNYYVSGSSNYNFFYPFAPVAAMIGGTKLNDICISTQGNIINNNIDGTIRAIGVFSGDAVVYNYGIGGTTVSVPKVIPFSTGSNQLTANYGALIEIYSPNTIQTEIYYEIGETYDNEFGAQSISLNDRTGDAFVINKKFKGRYWEKDATIVSMSPDADNVSGSLSTDSNTLNQFIPSWNKDIGRASVIDYDAKQVFYKSGVCFSNKYIQGSKVNGLCSFELSNYKLYPFEYGAITKMATISDTGSEGANGIKGNILLLLHENTSASVYINRNILTNPSGGSQLTQAEEVLGSYNPLIKAQGCIHPESFKQFNSVGIYYNQQKGTIVQYSINGNDLLSDNKARVFFYDVSEKLRAYADQVNIQLKDFVITGVFDPFYNEYLISFSRVLIGGQQVAYGDRFTIAYSMSLDRFVTYYEFYPEWMEYMITNFISFNKGQAYLHNSGNDFQFNNFYDDDNRIRQRESSIEIPINDDPSQVKQYLALKIESNIAMKADFTDKNGQNTGLVESDFELLEGKYYSELLNNENTVGFSDPLFNGDNMRSSTVFVKLRSKSNKLINLYSVTLSYIKSLL